MEPSGLKTLAPLIVTFNKNLKCNLCLVELLEVLEVVVFVEGKYSVPLGLTRSHYRPIDSLPATICGRDLF